MKEGYVRPSTPEVSYWLLGTDPLRRSYSDLEREATTRWDGVTDYVALKYLHDFDGGDEAMVCETDDEPAVVGVVRVVSDPYPDPLQGDSNYMVVDVETIGRLARPVPLADLDAEPDFRELEVEDLGELSVVPLTPRLWQRILELGGGVPSALASTPEGALVGEEEG